MREYHVNSHSKFSSSTYKEKLLIWRYPTLTRPLVMIGQDETIFKQYSSSQKCRVGPCGETQLLLKSNGYSRVTLLELCSICQKINLNKVKNEQRVSSEWCHYLSNKSALTAYGITKQKKIQDQLTLLRFFKVGIDLKGFLNYDQMSLQVEDIYDVLTIKLPHYDFLLLLLDQSSGHGRMREGLLNTNVMSSKFGGKQGKLIDTENKRLVLTNQF